MAGDTHPDHDTIAQFRKVFLLDLKDLFVQLLLCAHLAGVLALGNVSVDGTKLHADASKSQAVSYKHLLELEPRLQAEVKALFALAEQADQTGGPSAPPESGGGLVARGIDPYIATGRDPHHQPWHAYFADPPAPPLATASLRV